MQNRPIISLLSNKFHNFKKFLLCDLHFHISFLMFLLEVRSLLAWGRDAILTSSFFSFCYLCFLPWGTYPGQGNLKVHYGTLEIKKTFLPICIF